MHNDEQHLTALSICHYIYGALVGVLSCFPLIYVLVGVGLVVAAPSMEVKDPNERLGMQFAGGMFAIIGAVAAVIGLVSAGFTLLAGDFLRRRRGYLFCFIVAAIECLNMPLGTILGVFTIIVLVRPYVRQCFGVDPPAKPFV
jgi:hypothetical protein